MQSPTPCQTQEKRTIKTHNTNHRLAGVLVGCGICAISFSVFHASMIG